MKVGQLFVTPEAWPRSQASDSTPLELSASGTPAECVWHVGLHFPGIGARFAPTLYDALIATPVEGKLPTKLLSRLPEWTVYIETPGLFR